MALEEPHEQPSSRKPDHKLARSSADAVSTPSFELEKKEKQRRTGGLWLLSQHLESVSTRLLSLEITWKYTKIQDSFKYRKKLQLLPWQYWYLDSYSQERPCVETCLWLLVIFSVVSRGVCTLGQCGVFSSLKCRVWVNLCNCFCQKEAC